MSLKSAKKSRRNLNKCKHVSISNVENAKNVFEDRTAPRRRRHFRKVVSGKGLKQKSKNKNLFMVCKCHPYVSQSRWRLVFFWHQKSIQVAILLWKIELIFDAALSRKTCSLLTVSCCVTKAMSASKILSYMFLVKKHEIMKSHMRLVGRQIGRE